MKFSTVFTALVVIVPLFSGEALAAAQGNKGFGKGSKGVPPPPAKNNNKNNTATNNSTASNNSAASNSSAANNNAASNNNGGDNNPQTSFTLDPSVINTGSELTGQENATAGQSNSLTSTNNFINNCVGKTITDGLQIKTGSCNPTPMGDIPSVTNQPSCAFTFPANGQDIPANQTFTFSLGVQGMQTGDFTNADTTYFSAPQQLNAAGQIIGHNHITCQTIPSLTDTSIPNPQEFAFFKGLNAAAVNGALTAVVTGGLAPGAYKCCSITTSANHVPVACPVAQHGSFEDCIRFTASQGGDANNGNNGANGGNNNSTDANGGNNDSTGANGGNSNSTVTSGSNSTSTGANGGNSNSTVTSGSNSTSTAANSTSTAANGGNKNGSGANGGNNKNTGNGKNTGKTGGNANGQGGNKKGAGGRRRMVARLSRDH